MAMLSLRLMKTNTKLVNFLTNCLVPAMIKGRQVSRSPSAKFKRAEQLKNWQESETNKQTSVPKHATKVYFSTSILFLAACKSEDKEEIQKLLKTGADINTPNADGLTALHQACIDGNMDMVELLVNHGADVNQRDNEGWTPLHATASCGFDSIARFLIENGSDVAAVNFDGQLPMDIAGIPERMKMILKRAIDERGIDCAKCRNAEYTALLTDARQWAWHGYQEIRDPKTGGTPLHVAAAKGYTDVARTLLEDCKLDPNCVDDEGWTPLHAAALWGQKAVATVLLRYGADPNIKNYSGQTPFEVADCKMCVWLKGATLTIRTRTYNKSGSSLSTARGNSFKGTGSRSDTRNPAQGQTGASVNEEKFKEAVDKNVSLGRSNSFENNKNFYLRYRNTLERIEAAKTLGTSDVQRKQLLPTTNNSSTHTNVDVKNRPIVLPVRDDKSETQRKAHAKRVRETRRCTQIVTLEQIKSAERLLEGNSNAMSIPSTSTADTTTTIASEATVSSPQPSTSAVVPQAEAEATVTLCQPRTSSMVTASNQKNGAEQGSEELNNENDSPDKLLLGNDLGTITVASPATKAAISVIQRRRRSKRRSTGVGQVEVEEPANERGASGDASEPPNVETNTTEHRTEENDSYYKKLYEAAVIENKRLQEQIKSYEARLNSADVTIAQLQENFFKMQNLYLSERDGKRPTERDLSETKKN